MIYLETDESGEMRLVIECSHPGEREIAAAALDCMTWIPGMQDDPDYKRAMELTNGEGEMEPSERMDILRFYNRGGVSDGD